MLVGIIELRASNWGRNETDRTVGAGDSMNGRTSLNNWRVIVTALSGFAVVMATVSLQTEHLSEHVEMSAVSEMLGN